MEGVKPNILDTISMCSRSTSMKNDIGILILGSCFLNGCFLASGDEPRRDRGSLSGAMDKAKKSAPDERHVKGHVYDDPQTEPVLSPAEPELHWTQPRTPVSTRSEASDTTNSVQNTETIAGWLASVRQRNTPPINDYATIDTSRIDHSDFTEYLEFSYRQYFGAAYSTHAAGPLTGGTIGIGYSTRETSRWAFMLNLGYEEYARRNGEAIDPPIQQNIKMMYAQLTVRNSLTPYYTALGIEVPFGVGLRSMSWKYKHPLYITDYDSDGEVVNSETIDSDWVGGLDLNTGVTVNFLNTRRVLIGAEAIAGNVLWSTTTSEDFTNDYFHTTQYLKAGLFFTLRFW
jgi:hypothetical protein